MGVVFDFGAANPFYYRLSSLVRFHQHKHTLDAVEMMRVAIFAPVSRTWQAKRRDTVLPQGMAVALAFDDDDIVRRSRLAKLPQAVQAELRA